MSFTDHFIRRPVLAIVVNVLIAIGGIQAIRSLNVRQYPRSENAAVTITTSYIGASAELVRGFVTTPLERAIAGAEGIEYLESESTLGLSTIRARLKINQDATRALAEISAKVDQVRGDLPPEAEVPEISLTSADSEFASAYLSFASGFLRQNEITDYLSRIVEPRLSALDGVQRAEILGARTFAMRIWLDPDAMAARGVSPSEVRRALARNNFLTPAGQTKGALIQINLTSNTDLTSVREFEALVVRESAGGLVRLSDIATVSLGAESYDAEVRFSGETAVFIGVWVRPSSNALEVIQSVREELDHLRSRFPEQLQATVAYDATAYIESAIDDVVRTLTETLLIVVLVIAVFLGSLRTVLVPVVAIPVSLIGAVLLIQTFGFTINLLTLLAIVLSVGLVVDDAIVVVENVERRLAEGRDPTEAALVGARELFHPIIAMTITLAAVYLPIAFQGGLTGALFREFALTLAGAVVISGVVALTLSPVMSARLLRRSGEERGLARISRRAFARVRALYEAALALTMSVRPAIYTAWAGLFVLGLVMYQMSPKELAPAEDQGVVFGIVDTPAASTLDEVVRSTEVVNREMLALPEAAFSFQITFPTGGFGGVGLAPWDERTRTAFEIQPQLQARLARIPGVRVFSVLPPALPGGGTFPVEVVLASTAEAEELLDFGRRLARAAAESGLFAFPPQLDLDIDQPEAELVLDRDRVAELGLTLDVIGGDIAAAVGGGYVNRFNMAGRSYKVIPQLRRIDRLNPEQLTELHVTGPDGGLITLSNLAEIERHVVPRSLNRFQQLNSVKLSGVPTTSLDQALSFLEAEAARILPRGYSVDYTGESRQLRTEGNRFLPAFSLAVVIIFLVLAAQFDSFRDPLVILAGSVPLAMFGALLVTFLEMPNPMIPYPTDGLTTTLNVYSQIGLVTLVGLVAKNGILIVSFANDLQRQGRPKVEAVSLAAATRLRPILMTSAATVFGHLPLTLVTGPGALARNSIGLVLVAGMTVGTFFTLFFVPSLYVLLARTHRRADDRAAPTPPGSTRS